MPPGKRPQSNAMLYTLVTFVGLFIILAVLIGLQTSGRNIFAQLRDAVLPRRDR